MPTFCSSLLARVALGSVVLVLGGCTADSEPETAAPSVSTSGAPSATPGQSASVAGVTALETMSGALPPGKYAAKVPYSGADTRAVIDVPDGFTTDGTNLFRAEDGKGTGLRAVSFWTVAEVHTDPCHGSGYKDPGPTVQDLATALARQPLGGTDEPAPVSLGGYDGRYLELSVPADLDLADCVDDRVERWRFDDSDRRWAESPGEVDRVWIIDVEGNRVVVDAIHTPGASTTDIDQLTRMVESITFTNMK
jgi:hypothetical protein